MKRIAYIELDTHAEIARNFYVLMNDSAEFEVDYYFSNKVLKQLNYKENENIIFVRPGNLFEILSKNKEENGNYDLVIIGTAHRYFNVFCKVSANFNTSIIIHNVNFSRLNSIHLFLNIFKKESIYRLKLLLKEGLLSKNKLVKTAKQLFILDDNLENKKGELQFLPLFYSENDEEKISENISIVIPGAVSQERRDYKSVLFKIENWSKDHLNRNSKLEIVFLGKAQNEELNWLKDFKNKNLENVKIIYFEEKVTQDEFDFHMNKATYLWCPLQISTTFFSNDEQYGISKMSGIIGDAIKYKKIAFVPENYPTNHSFLVQDQESLELQLDLFSKLNAEAIFDRFGKQKVLSKLNETLNKFI